MGSTYCIHKWTFCMYKKMIPIPIARFVQDFCWNYYITATCIVLSKLEGLILDERLEWRGNQDSGREGFQSISCSLC